MGFYDEMRDIATGLLQEFSQATEQLPIKYIFGSGELTVKPDWRPDIKPLTDQVAVDVHAVVKGVSHKYLANKFAIVGDLEITMQADATGLSAPSVKDHFLINDQYYKIMHVEAVPAAGTPVIYKCVVRSN